MTSAPSRVLLVLCESDVVTTSYYSTELNSVIGDYRRNFVCDDGDLSPLLKVVVTVNTTFAKWNLQSFKQF